MDSRHSDGFPQLVLTKLDLPSGEDDGTEHGKEQDDACQLETCRESGNQIPTDELRVSRTGIVWDTNFTRSTGLDLADDV